MFSLAFYWSLTVSQFFDVKRKDFWQMFVHHIATICLMAFSWVCNLHRIGTLVLLVHDCADIFLEVSCMCLTFVWFVCEFINAYFRCLHLCIHCLSVAPELSTIIEKYSACDIFFRICRIFPWVHEFTSGSYKEACSAHCWLWKGC